MSIIAAADGSALGNPGPAGWAWYIDASTWRAGGWEHGTNNMGELKAVLDLLEATAGDADQHLEILCDSQYVINSVTKWMPGWKRKGWRKKDGKPVLNVELLKAIDAALAGRSVEFTWVKGHAGHAMNEAADARARAAATAFSKGQDPDIGPGYRGAVPAATGLQAAAHSSADGLDDPTDAAAEDLFSLFDAEPAHEAPDADAYREQTPAEEVTARELALLDDRVRTDSAAVASLLHPDFTEIGASGRAWTRQEMLEEIGADGPIDAVDMVTEEIAPGVQLLTYESITPERRCRRSSLWVREEGEWLLRHHQGTVIPDGR